MEDSADRLSAVARFMRALTPQGVALAMIFAGGVLVLYVAYESRAEWAAVVWKSPWAIAMVFGSALTLWAGTSIAALHRRVQAQLDAAQVRIEAQTTDRIRQLERDIKACHDEREQQRHELATLHVEARTNAAQLAVVREELRGFRLRTRSSDFGPLGEGG